MPIPLNCCHECKSAFFKGEEIYILPQKCICSRCFKYLYLKEMGGATQKLIEEGNSFLTVTYYDGVINGSVISAFLKT